MNSQSPIPPSLWEVEFRVADITSRQQGIAREKITPESRIIEDLNIDSLDLVELIIALEEEFRVSIPDDIGKQMFVRSPLTISALAEIVRDQWGTGVLERKRWFGPRPKQVAPMTIPFTQLGGAHSKREWQDGPLHEAMASTAEGFSQFRRRTDGMRCVLVPAAEVELGSCASDGSEDEHPKHQVRMDSFGTCAPCGPFPGVKTPGYSQDVPPGHTNVAAAFSAKQATRSFNDGFKGISQPRCPAMSHARFNPAIRISCFVILSGFVIRHSSFCPPR